MAGTSASAASAVARVSPEWQARTRRRQDSALNFRLYARRHGLTLVEYRQAVEEILAAYLAAAEVRVRVWSDNLAAILDERRLKGFLERGTRARPGRATLRSRALHQVLVEQRLWIDEHVFGVPRDAPPQSRPIFGYLAGPDEAAYSPGAARYGDVVLRLKADVRLRSTWNFGDSGCETRAGQRPRVATSPVAAPSSVSVRSCDDLISLHHRGRLAPADYLEAQVFGGVGVGDVCEVVLPGLRSSPPGTSDGLARELDRLGIPWRLAEGQET